eukprot:11153906-Alexandrium_andersonii.AAC.1
MRLGSLVAFQRFAFWSGCASTFELGAFQRLHFRRGLRFALSYVLVHYAFRCAVRQCGVLSG